MRKFIAVLTLLTIFAGAVLVTPVLASANSTPVSHEEALNIVRQNFEVPDKNYQVSYREENYRGEKKIWSFSWSYPSYLGEFHHVSVEVDAVTGEIIRFMKHENRKNPKKTVKLMSEEECEVIAKNLIKQLAPDKLDEIKKKEVPFYKYEIIYGNNIYRYMYQRYVNGIPFPENNIIVGVNAETGKVTEYGVQWDRNIKFHEVENCLTNEQAEEIFREKIGLQLMYYKPYRAFPLFSIADKQPVQLYYTIYNSGAFYIDAVTGKILDSSGKEIEVKDIPIFEPKEQEQPTYEKSNKPLTLEEAKAKIKSYFKIPADYVLESSNYSEHAGDPERKTWEFSYRLNEGYTGHIHVQIDALTGELISYHHWDEESALPDENHKVTYDFQKCKDIALSYVNKLAPEKSEHVYLFSSPEQSVNIVNGKAMVPKTYYFRFIRIVNGIPYDSNSINIEVDNTTGELRSYHLQWEYNHTFESPEGIIPENEAVEKILSDESIPTLMYILKRDEKGAYSGESIPVYSVFGEAPLMVNAKTGEIVNQYEMDIPKMFSDVRGHWAAREIFMLSSWGILHGKGDKFEPDKAITRAEFATMLSAVQGLEASDSSPQLFTDVPKTAWYYNSVQAAAEAGLVKGRGNKFEPDKAITRQEMAVMLINLLNDGKNQTPELNLSGKFKDENKISDWAKNQVIQAVELGIMTGSDNLLKPLQPATRAEAVVMLYKAVEIKARYGKYSVGLAESITKAVP